MGHIPSHTRYVPGSFRKFDQGVSLNIENKYKIMMQSPHLLELKTWSEKEAANLLTAVEEHASFTHSNNGLLNSRRVGITVNIRVNLATRK